MRRREVRSHWRSITRRAAVALMTGASMWPLAARAQQKLPVVGVLSAATKSEFAGRIDAFRRGVAAGGFVEGQTVSIAYRYADVHYERLPGLARDRTAYPPLLSSAASSPPASS